MIEPRLVTLGDLFSDRTHYQVPIYQRSYVWDREEQWTPLWEDLEETTKPRLNNEPGTAHFLGAIVIELTSAEPGRVKTYSVIDGQQRLTTLQLLLAALRSVATELDPEREDGIRRLLINEGRHAEGLLKFKVAPGEYDRGKFTDIVNSVPEDMSMEKDGIPGAYHYFRGEIDGWLREGDASDGAALERLDALQDTMEGLLQVVAIQLDGSSDAQVIFETLNSRGADLTSLDLAKNSLFRRAERDGAKVSELHSTYWEPALGDADYWLETVRQGRYTSERADLFLMHWLTMKTGKPARVQHLFADFRKRYLPPEQLPSPAKDLVMEISRDATIFRSFDDLPPNSVEGRFFHRLGLMDTTTLLPVALLLFRGTELIDSRRQRALQALESWLVRRMLLGATTQHYNRLLASLLKTLHEQPSLANADDVIIESLRAYSNPTDTWPNDSEVLKRLETQPLYNSISRTRIRLLLEACEQRLADTNKTEQLPLPDRLSIEHALPQQWHDHWPLPSEHDSEDDIIERDARVDRLGNLTLVTSALNSSLSNSEWSVKRAELAKRSQLLVNQRLCAHQIWNDALIDERSAELACLVVESWPGPNADRWSEGAAT
jgi:hypothetical protein